MPRICHNWLYGGNCYRQCFTPWGPTDEIKAHYPAKHSDYRDSLPEDLKTVYDLYHPVVRRGAWTFGLFEMWFWKAKAVKHSVHIPCWDSFKWNPLKWRGICFGRTMKQCYWTGLRQTRWARAVYAANLGREYIMPVIDISQRGGGYQSDIKALCWMYFIMGTVFSCGIGQLFSLCGNFLCNFGAVYSCHAREKIRRKYRLPPTFGLPPGIDDCLVHFLCFYCASHQEVRELAVRGVDGPGMHILDVLPHEWDHVPGHESVVAARQEVVAAMLSHPPRLFKPRLKQAVEFGPAADTLAALASHPGGAAATAAARDAAAVTAAEKGGREAMARALQRPSIASTGSGEGLGWVRYRPPRQQEMERAAATGCVPLAPALHQTCTHERDIPGPVPQEVKQHSGTASPPGAVHVPYGSKEADLEALLQESSHLPLVQEQDGVAGRGVPRMQRSWSIAF